jgi:hypothetical protein
VLFLHYSQQHVAVDCIYVTLKLRKKSNNRISRSLQGNPKGRDHLRGLQVNGRIILKWFFKEVGCEGVYWIYLSE